MSTSLMTTGVLWTHDLEPSDIPMVSSIIPVPDLGIAVASDGRALYALRMQTGERIWGIPAAQGPIAGLAVDNVSVYITDGPLLRSISLRDGSEQWRYADSALSDPYVSPPVGGAHTVLTLGPDATVRAVRASNGAELWTRRYTDEITSPPALDDTAVYYVGDGVVQAVDQMSGQLKWRFVPETGGPQCMQQLIRAGRGLVAVAWPNGYAINAQTGVVDSAYSFLGNPEPEFAVTDVVISPDRPLMCLGNNINHAFVKKYDTGFTGYYPGEYAPQPSSSNGTITAAFAGAQLVLCQVQGDAGTSRLSLVDVGTWSAAYQDLPESAGFTVNGIVLPPPTMMMPDLRITSGVVYLPVVSPDAFTPPNQPLVQVQAVRLM
ncbi:MAG TPA: PQQ-binding-like beta-propeller repeat protein [Longimicrobiales bacterium]|nr:PQQ-binding-like beta-propeller repeat protein [Longimicrobiales bacterium]